MHRPSRITQSLRDGFSLIEMAMLLIIIGLVASAVIPRVIKKTEQEVFREGRSQTRSMRDEIVGFAMENCYLPNNATVADMAYSHKGDRWAGTTRYRPNLGLLKSAIVSPATINSANPEGLYVKTPDGVSSTVAFVLASPGKNGVLETSLSGPQVEIKNYQESGGSIYDDVVDYVTVDYLRGQTVGCDKAPILGGGGSGGGDPPITLPPSSFALASSGAGGMAMGWSANVKGNVYSRGDLETDSSATIQGNLTVNGDAEIGWATKVTGSVYARGDVTLDSSAEVHGDIHASGDVTLGWASKVYGNIYTNGTVTMDTAVEVGGNINALGFVDMAGSVQGSVISGGRVDVNWGGHIYGNVDAAGVIVVDSGGRIDGYARSGSTVSGSSRIGGTITQNSPAPPRLTPTPPTGFLLPTAPKETTFSAGGTNISVSYGNSRDLTAASYGTLTLSGANTLTLHGAAPAANYYFTSISGEWDVTLRLDLSAGPINIFVVNSADFSSGNLKVQVSTNGSSYSSMTSVAQSLASKVYLETHRDWSMGTSSQWFGTIYASRDIDFGDSNTIIGSYYAKRTLTTDSDLSVIYVQSDYAKANW